MEALQRFQPLDFLLILLWAVIVAWGVASGVVRQTFLLFGVYAGVIAASQLYQPVASMLIPVFGRDFRERGEWLAYLAVFGVVFAIVLFLTLRTYPRTRILSRPRLDTALGTVLAAVWGSMLLIAIITVLRFFVRSFWPGAEFVQQVVDDQVRRSQVALFLELVAAPIWALMTPWFPDRVPPILEH